ncbi:hypothetical protein BO94DRAFT_118485 [Aspergillus sclerotioniger CBS 115572]|uniref:Uncharacterized protein n=1 Tax=Aspergillus sclerotioniger CBS 115572 TaxID=1450535 RepID=A0A317WDG8_9EURO|nr:hypothetical protein BO94DRAFT_118485 [Aspergillus sclerotioniger CBS 115572]PWY83098.1 hypothetical protein BO94DRAFT_118485 [Aspergillus sclerotioniger CBS 115572]
MTSPSKTHHQPAASSNKVPSLHTIQPMKRSISYSPAQDDEHIASSKASESRGSDHMVKAALMELLNDDGVKASARGSRSVQNLLMDTEKALRKQRRESLSGRASISVSK